MASCNTNSGAIYTKTKMCTFFMKGQCARGSACTYAHSAKEQRANPDLSRTQMCSAFLSGTCKNGRRCSYAHHESELRVLGKKNRQCRIQQANGNGSGPDIVLEPTQFAIEGSHSQGFGQTQYSCAEFPSCNSQDAQRGYIQVVVAFVPHVVGCGVAATQSFTDDESDGTTACAESRSVSRSGSESDDESVWAMQSEDGVLCVKNTFLDFKPVDDTFMCMRRMKSAPAAH